MTRLALIKDIRYMEHDPGPGHPESPNRLKVIYSMLEQEFPDLPVITPRLAAEGELALIHDPFYIQEVAKTEGRLHSQLDPDTGLSARSYEISRLAAGGLLDAVDGILRRKECIATAPQSDAEELQAVFALVRPPGHHAEPERGMGFCLFNNVAIAAEYARRTYGLKRILIVDWDLHHGNGTQKAFYDDPDVLYFSSHQYPHYPGTGGLNEVGFGKGEGFTINAPFPSGFGDAEYIAVYERILRPVALEFGPELVIVSAGFDPYVKDPLGGMEVTGPGFGALGNIIRDIAEKTCGGRAILSLEGGYNPEGLREGVREIVKAFLYPAGYQHANPSPACARVMDSVISIQKKYWKSLQ